MSKSREGQERKRRKGRKGRRKEGKKENETGYVKSRVRDGKAVGWESKGK